MRVYHASSVEVSHPDTVHSRKFLDFGRGFYVTTLYEQAVRYAQRFSRRQEPACVNVYDFTDDLSAWRVLSFDSYSEEWLDFVVKCRSGQQTEEYDLVIGGIANDRVIETLSLYFDHVISKEEALGKLKFEKPNIQYCIRSEKMIRECLTFIECVKL